MQLLAIAAAGVDRQQSSWSHCKVAKQPLNTSTNSFSPHTDDGNDSDDGNDNFGDDIPSLESGSSSDEDDFDENDIEISNMEVTYHLFWIPLKIVLTCWIVSWESSIQNYSSMQQESSPDPPE